MSETPLGVWVRCRWVYGWDTNTCMGETPQQLWARRRGAAELISTNPQPPPCVMWNKTGWKSVIIKVDSWQQRRLWIMWIVNIANFTLKLMSGQLIAELTLKWLPNWSSLFCHAKIRRHSTSATRDQQITHTNNLKIDIVDVGLPTSSTSTHRHRRHRLGGCGRGSTQVLKERKRRKGSRKSYSLNTNWCLQAKWKCVFKVNDFV